MWLNRHSSSLTACTLTLFIFAQSCTRLLLPDVFSAPYYVFLHWGQFNKALYVFGTIAFIYGYRSVITNHESNIKQITLWSAASLDLERDSSPGLFDLEAPALPSELRCFGVFKFVCFHFLCCAMMMIRVTFSKEKSRKVPLRKFLLFFIA